MIRSVGSFPRRLRSALLLLCISVVALACGEDGGGACGATPVVLIGSGGTGPNVGDLQLLDAETGAPLGFIDTEGLCDATPCEIGRAGAMQWDPISELLVMGMGGSAELCSGCIVVVDLSTGEASILWSNDIIQTAVGMAFMVDAVGGLTRDSDGRFWATVKYGEGGEVGLIHFTLTEGPTYVGLTGVAAETDGVDYDLGNALTFSGGELLFTSGPGLSTVDPATADATLVGAITYDGFSGLDEDPNGTRINSMTTLPCGSVAAVLEDASSRYFGFLAPETRVFSTTAFYAGTSIDSAGVPKLNGLAAVPLSAVAESMLSFPE